MIVASGVKMTSMVLHELRRQSHKDDFKLQQGVLPPKFNELLDDIKNGKVKRLILVSNGADRIPVRLHLLLTAAFNGTFGADNYRFPIPWIGAINPTNEKNAYFMPRRYPSNPRGVSNETILKWASTEYSALIHVPNFQGKCDNAVVLRYHGCAPVDFSGDVECRLTIERDGLGLERFTVPFKMVNRSNQLRHTDVPLITRLSLLGSDVLNAFAKDISKVHWMMHLTSKIKLDFVPHLSKMSSSPEYELDVIGGIARVVLKKCPHIRDGVTVYHDKEICVKLENISSSLFSNGMGRIDWVADMSNGQYVGNPILTARPSPAELEPSELTEMLYHAVIHGDDIAIAVTAEVGQYTAAAVSRLFRAAVLLHNPTARVDVVPYDLYPNKQNTLFTIAINRNRPVHVSMFDVEAINKLTTSIVIADIRESDSAFMGRDFSFAVLLNRVLHRATITTSIGGYKLITSDFARKTITREEAFDILKDAIAERNGLFPDDIIPHGILINAFIDLSSVHAHPTIFFVDDTNFVVQDELIRLTRMAQTRMVQDGMTLITESQCI